MEGRATRPSIVFFSPVVCPLFVLSHTRDLPVNLRYQLFTIRLKRRFSLASGSRTETAAVLVAIDDGMLSGFGEAALPPYRSETVDSVISFLRDLILPSRLGPDDISGFLRNLHEQGEEHPGALAAVDMALHDLVGKQNGFRWFEQWGLKEEDVARTSFTIGIGDRDDIREQVRGASAFSFLKIKLGGSDDRGVISCIREITDTPIRVDVNQGWDDREEAAATIDWLAGRNVELIEQPLPADRPDDQLWLRERSQLPLVADEAADRTDDLGVIATLYHGVNIKLMKCGGMVEGKRMIEKARTLGLGVMLGCMTETSCAISAAAQLAPMAGWIDLDGALLIANDPFYGVSLVNGTIEYSSTHGNGVRVSTTEGSRGGLFLE
ncbi:MAG: dipeptide epimerase [Ignavibacteria bacterium]|nr:dipeptide epimerase [Ignavibacteria bacterium]